MNPSLHELIQINTQIKYAIITTRMKGLLISTYAIRLTCTINDQNEERISAKIYRIK